MNIRSSLSVAAAIALSIATSAAFAVTETTTFDASAEVIASCSIEATDLDFGQIDPLANADTDVNSSVTVVCTNGHGYDVGLNAGAGAGATVAVRKMTGGAGTLDYSLYSDTLRTTVWGNTVDTDTVSGTGNGTEQVLTVHGRVPSQPTAMVGSDYSDTVTVTITY